MQELTIMGNKNDNRTLFCRRLVEYLPLNYDQLISGVCQSSHAKIGSSEVFILATASKSYFSCRLLIAGKFDNKLLKSMLAYGAFSVAETGGVPYFDSGQNLPGWRLLSTVFSEQGALRIVEVLDNLSNWLDSVKSPIDPRLSDSIQG